MTPGKLATIFPITIATSLIEGEEFSNNSEQTFCQLVAFSLASCIVIATEFITNPRIVSTCVGMKVDFCVFAHNLKGIK